MSYRPFPSEFPILRGEGLTLRELSEGDLPAWFERLSDREAAKLAGDPVATSMDVVLEGLAYHRRAFQEQSGLRWAIVSDDLEISVGTIGFVALNEAKRTSEIGAAIGRTHWDHGLGTRAANLVIEYGFSHLALLAIEAVALPENQRTHRILEKLGFNRSEEACSDGRAVGGRLDSVFYSLDQESWLRRPSLLRARSLR